MCKNRMAHLERTSSGKSCKSWFTIWQILDCFHQVAPFYWFKKKNEKTKNKLIKKAKEHYQLNVTGVVPQLDHNNPCLMDHGLDLLSLMFHKATKFLM